MNILFPAKTVNFDTFPVLNRCFLAASGESFSDQLTTVQALLAVPVERFLSTMEAAR